ncbi:MAG: hypothetical protein K8U57_08255 [Planctomycetes bacterium]|nr:hypothetical protein [Planctomycetota bacterium]
MIRWADHTATTWVLAGLAFSLAAVGALPYAGGFNDGSRLATTESLVDRGTLCIDDSIFATPSFGLLARGMPPYNPDIPNIETGGTLDKVRIDGHFYSDKPPILAILTAGAYRVLMFVGLPSPAERPDVFCRTATTLSSGISYAVAVGFMWVLGRLIGLPAGLRLIWLGSFALATVLPGYTRHVNPSLPQTAALAGLAVFLLRTAQALPRIAWGSLALAGTFAGFGYTLDLGGGPSLLACAAIGLFLRTRRIAAVGMFLLAAAPWIATHHALTYSVGRVWVPLGMVPEFLNWPGSPFDPSNMTGFWRHTPHGFVIYIWELLFSYKGLLTCNLPLFLALAGGWRVLTPTRQQIELISLLAWCVATFGMYAVLSDNRGGGCLSIRWFVPFLVPGFWLLGRLLVQRPRTRVDFVLLSAFGFLLAIGMWTVGPWPSYIVPYLEQIVFSALGTWVVIHLAVRLWARRT